MSWDCLPVYLPVSVGTNRAAPAPRSGQKMTQQAKLTSEISELKLAAISLPLSNRLGSFWLPRSGRVEQGAQIDA